MTDKQFVKAYKQETFETTTVKVLVEDYGFRLRQTKRTKDANSLCEGSLWEIGTTYFYESQNSCFRHLRDLKALGEREGFDVIPVRIGYYGDYVRPIEKLSKSAIEFNMKPWPKNSWASLFVRIVTR